MSSLYTRVTWPQSHTHKHKYTHKLSPHLRIRTISPPVSQAPEESRWTDAHTHAYRKKINGLALIEQHIPPPTLLLPYTGTRLHHARPPASTRSSSPPRSVCPAPRHWEGINFLILTQLSWKAPGSAEKKRECEEQEGRNRKELWEIRGDSEEKQANGRRRRRRGDRKARPDASDSVHQALNDPQVRYEPGLICKTCLSLWNVQNEMLEHGAICPGEISTNYMLRDEVCRLSLQSNQRHRHDSNMHQ